MTHHLTKNLQSEKSDQVSLRLSLDPRRGNIFHGGGGKQDCKLTSDQFWLPYFVEHIFVLKKIRYCVCMKLGDPVRFFFSVCYGLHSVLVNHFTQSTLELEYKSLCCLHSVCQINTLLQILCIRKSLSLIHQKKWSKWFTSLTVLNLIYKS